MCNCNKYLLEEKRKLLKEMNELVKEIELETIKCKKNCAEKSDRQSTSDLVFGNFAKRDEKKGVTSSYCDVKNDPNPATSLGLKFDDIVGAFKHFSGDNRQNVRAWIANFEQQCNEFGFTQIQTFIIAKRMMKDNAKLFVEFESSACNWQKLKRELIEEFGKAINSSLIHQKLKERKKRTNESTIAYLYEMLSIAALGDVDVSATITYTIDGLPGSADSKNFMYEATTLGNFKAKLAVYEILQGRNFETETKKSTTTIRCFNCGSKSHDKTACPYKEKGARCFKCDAFGHVSSSCPKTEALTNKRINIIQPFGEEEEEDDVEKDMYEWTKNEMGRRGINFE